MYPRSLCDLCLRPGFHSKSGAPCSTLVQATACTFANPFKVGVHFDGDENIAAAGDVAGKLAKVENGGIVASATTATEFPGNEKL